MNLGTQMNLENRLYKALNELQLGSVEIAEQRLQECLDVLKKERESYIELYRTNNDINGNPRYVVHFLSIDKDYDTACKMAKKIGGKKYRGKDFGGGIVFQSYNMDDLRKQILEISNTRP